MKKAVLQFTACCMAVGVSVASFGEIAFADQIDSLAGFGLIAEADPSEEENTVLADGEEDAGGSAQQVIAEEVGNEPEKEDAWSETAEQNEIETIAAEAEENSDDVDYGVIKYDISGEEKTESEDESESETETEDPSVPGSGTVQTGEDDEENLEQAVAQCEDYDYINVRASADMDGAIIGRLYNNNAVTILEEDGEWCRIKSGNVIGYVKTQYLGTGEETSAGNTSQRVATVQADVLTLRASGSEDAAEIGVLYENDQVKVLSEEGDWIKIQLDDGSCGYVSAEYVTCEDAQTSGVTDRQEQASLNGEVVSVSYSEPESYYEESYYEPEFYYEESYDQPDSYYEESYYEPEFYYEESYDQPEFYYEESYDQPDSYYEESYDQPESYYEESYYESDSYYEEIDDEPESYYEETSYESSVTYTDSTSVDAAYQNYVEKQEEADAATQQADASLVYETYDAAVEAYQEYLNAVSAADTAAYTETQSTETSADETQSAETSAKEETTTETYTYTETYVDTASVDAAYQNYVEKQEEADAATQQADESLVYETYDAAVEAYQEYLDAAEGETVTVTETVQESVNQDGSTEKKTTVKETQETAAKESASKETQETTAKESASKETQETTAKESASQETQETTAKETAAQETAAKEAASQETQETAAQETVVEEAAAETTSSSGSEIASFATQFVGNPYVYGGTSLTNGADCSGFTQSVFANFGISIPRTAAEQSQSGTAVSLDELEPGDLLFYSDGSGIGHVTMYIGDDQVVHASTSSTGIIISDIGYRTPVSARRYW